MKQITSVYSSQIVVSLGGAVQSFNPFAERTRNPLEFIMSKSMGWFLHSWNEKYAYFFCFVVFKISAHIVMPRLKGNKP